MMVNERHSSGQDRGDLFFNTSVEDENQPKCSTNQPSSAVSPKSGDQENILSPTSGDCLDEEIFDEIPPDNCQFGTDLIPGVDFDLPNTSSEKRTVPQNGVVDTAKVFSKSKMLCDRSDTFIGLVKASQKDRKGKRRNLYVPLVMDTEFITKLIHLQQVSRTLVTTQARSCNNELGQGLIFAGIEVPHLNLALERYGLPRLPVVHHDFHALDYLEQMGVKFTVKEADPYGDRHLPKLIFEVFAHFATAELNMVFSGRMKERVKELQRSKGDERIECGRRVRCLTRIEGTELNYVSLNHVISFGGELNYTICLKIIDTAGLHGTASYANIAKAVGIDLPFKDTLSKKDKENILDFAIMKPATFLNYALGDLEVYNILVAYRSQWFEVYRLIGFEDYFQPPKLTIGGSVKDLFLASLSKYFALTDSSEKGKWTQQLKEIIQQFIEPSSAGYLRKNIRSTSALLAKVEGGRCRNNRPTDINSPRKLKNLLEANLIGDLDVKGCYGEGQRNQNTFFGTPEIYEHRTTAKNRYTTLRQWLKEYEVNLEALLKAVKNKDSTAWNHSDNWGELISGAWYARINADHLEYSQDFFSSWFLNNGYSANIMAKYISQLTGDEDYDGIPNVELDEDAGNTKIFNHQILNGVLTHDGLEFILNRSPRQRNELLDNIVILASAVYPRSKQIDPDNKLTGSERLTQLTETYENWEHSNTTTRIIEDGLKFLRCDYKECHAWFGVNLGDLLISNLLIEREKAKILHGKKSPLDLLFKLCINTLYGDLVSKYFIISNPVVGNNITARARAIVWYMEKGLHSFQSITDGGGFELNGVVYPAQDKVGNDVNLHRPDSALKRYKLSRKPLGDCDEILGEIVNGDVSLHLIKDGECTVLSPDESVAWIDKAAMAHLQNLFPLVTVLHAQTFAIKVSQVDDQIQVALKERVGQFSFDMKKIWSEAAFRSSADYLFLRYEGKEIVEEQVAEEGEVDEPIIEELVKSRGNEKENHKSYLIENGMIKTSNRYTNGNSPGRDVLLELLKNPTCVNRQQPTVKSGILKIGEYKAHNGKYDSLDLEPGDNLLKARLLTEFTPTTLTFQNHKQFVSWNKAISKMREESGQSLESFYLNADGTLDYQKMVVELDSLIARGVINPLKELDKSCNRQRDSKRSKTHLNSENGINLVHPHKEFLEYIKDQLNQ